MHLPEKTKTPNQEMKPIYTHHNNCQRTQNRRSANKGMEKRTTTHQQHGDNITQELPDNSAH
eukprot:6295729-Lingulodinium_polyedra.AAC.1